jgi:hypothetical protein
MGLQHTNKTQRHSDVTVVHFVVLDSFCLCLLNRDLVYNCHVTALSISDKNIWLLLMLLLFHPCTTSVSLSLCHLVWLIKF